MVGTACGILARGKLSSIAPKVHNQNVIPPTLVSKRLSTLGSYVMSTGSLAGHDGNADQIAYWNGPGGQHWADRQQTQDILLTPVSEILIDRAGAQPGNRIVDVGCGCGATTVALAAKVGPSGRVVGIDISAPMLARARQ